MKKDIYVPGLLLLSNNSKTIFHMRQKLILIFLVLSTSIAVAQTDSISEVMSSESTETMMQDSIANTTENTQQFIPQKMMFTQRLLWGKNGLLRNSKTNPEDEMYREMKIRNKMITAHKFLGYATLVGLAGTCITGILLENGKNVRGLHSGLAGITNVAYFSTAALAFFSPPRKRGLEKGWNKTKVHRILSFVHLTGMIATNILGGLSEHNHSMVKYHRIAAITTFSSYMAGTIVFKL